MAAFHRTHSIVLLTTAAIASTILTTQVASAVPLAFVQEVQCNVTEPVCILVVPDGSGMTFQEARTTDGDVVDATVSVLIWLVDEFGPTGPLRASRPSTSRSRHQMDPRLVVRRTTSPRPTTTLMPKAGPSSRSRHARAAGRKGCSRSTWSTIRPAKQAAIFRPYQSSSTVLTSTVTGIRATKPPNTIKAVALQINVTRNHILACKWSTSLSQSSRIDDLFAV
jgi:hypothetical protein